MRIHPAGTGIIILLFIAVVLILGTINLIFPVQTFIHHTLYLIGAVFIFLVIRFFRRPDRKTPINDQLIYSAADGKVVAIEETFEKEFFKEKRLLVSVFMSLVDAHINWFPVSGKIVYVKHTPGHFYAAYVPKSSELNEHNTLVVENSRGAVLTRQIAGALAKRIICKHKANNYASQGGEIGLIKFGSRLDLFLPLGTQIDVKIGQQVYGGRTVVGRFAE